ncbi:hypothetical protein [Treponema bryantii]|uniref:hypothetical protein n=1 Tax=Treponema bryantii TaxID=163 RepID=UPI002B2878D8|nr:hypothetical protein TRBR_14720 [Treponema bryantii]
MTEEYEPIVLHRNEKGRFVEQIKLGKNFLTDINQMAKDIFETKANMIYLKTELTSLNWKINSMITNKIQFNLNGCNLNDFTKKINSVEANNFVKVIENISQGLYALINDFNNHRESGDPRVIRDHIVMLSVIYQKFKNNSFFKLVITKKQEEMIENQFIDCISLFNQSIDNGIKQKNWRVNFNINSAFFGGCYLYDPIDSIPDSELKACKLDFTITQIECVKKSL